MNYIFNNIEEIYKWNIEEFNNLEEIYNEYKEMEKNIYLNENNKIINYYSKNTRLLIIKVKNMN